MFRCGAGNRFISLTWGKWEVSSNLTSFVSNCRSRLPTRKGDAVLREGSNLHGQIRVRYILFGISATSYLSRATEPTVSSRTRRLVASIAILETTLRSRLHFVQPENVVISSIAGFCGFPPMKSDKQIELFQRHGMSYLNLYYRSSWYRLSLRLIARHPPSDLYGVLTPATLSLSQANPDGSLLKPSARVSCSTVPHLPLQCLTTRAYILVSLEQGTCEIAQLCHEICILENYSA